MKKYKFLSIVTLALGLTFTSCDNYLDINTNPNYPGTATMSTLLPSVGASTIAQLGLNGDLIGSMWMQYVTQGNSTNQYNTTCLYSLTTANYNAFWTNAYSNTFPDIKIILEQAEEEEAWNYWVIATVMKAYNFHILTDLYGDIPFTQANNSEYPNPEYDDSKTVVYPGILAMLDSAIAKEADAMASSNPSIGGLDFFFGGNMANWIAFAKTLKLKILMRDFNANQAAITALVEAGGLLTTDCAMVDFEDATNKGNPLYEYNIRQLNTRENMRACHTFLEYLLEYEDPRVAYYYELTYNAQLAIANGAVLPDSIKYEGLPYGDKPNTGEVEIVATSRFKQAYNDPVYLMNKAEIGFMVAEVYARTGNSSKAKEAYDEAVKAAFERFGLDGSSFVAADGAYEFDSSSEEKMMLSIMTQKWVSYAKANSWDGWFDRNRTGIPAISDAETVRESYLPRHRTLTDGYVLGTLVDPADSVLQPGEYPRRLLVPDASSQYNPNAPATKSLVTPMWWQVQ